MKGLTDEYESGSVLCVLKGVNFEMTQGLRLVWLDARVWGTIRRLNLSKKGGNTEIEC